MKSLLFLSLLLLSFQTSIACDICGCSSGGMSGGLFPQFQNNLLGIRYTPSIFTHPQDPGNFNGLSQVNRDIYHDAEAFFRWFPSKKLQLWFNVPYRLRIREESMRTTQISGIGDVQFSGVYTLIRRDSATSKWKHLLLAGGGVSLPTGKYQQRDETLVMLPIGFQVGTGSWSASANLLYMLRFGNWGTIAQGDYRAFSINERQFKKGNVSSAQLSFFRQFNLSSKSRIFIHAGLRHEQLAEDKEFEITRVNTGSNSSWLTTTAELFFGSFLVSLQSQIPISQSYYGSQPLPGIRNSASIAWVW